MKDIESLLNTSDVSNSNGVNCEFVATFENVHGLYVNGCDFSILQKDSHLSEHDKELLRQYGALI